MGVCVTLAGGGAGLVKKAIRRPTMADVAAAAGVGPATVDRVLNERGNVSEDVRRKVIAAARQLGLRRKLPPSYRPLIRINLILPRPNLPLLEHMAQEFRKIVGVTDRSLNLQITTLPDERPESVAQALSSTSCNAVIVYAQDDPVIRVAVDQLAEKSIPVVTMISDLPGTKRLAYAGTNHRAAGRSAAFFICRMAPGPGAVVIVCNHLGFQSHADRVAGFREYLAEHPCGLEIARIVEGLDDRGRTETRLRTAFQDIQQTVAVYNVGAANLGVRAAIEADVLPRRPLFMGHELTVHTARMLRDGVMTLTIDQSPKLQAQFAVDVLLDHFGYEGISVTAPYVSTVPIVLYSAENIPEGN
jgi:LacI family transcriptional regulator